MIKLAKKKELVLAKENFYKVTLKKGKNSLKGR
jgi:hypothetical protein